MKIEIEIAPVPGSTAPGMMDVRITQSAGRKSRSFHLTQTRSRSLASAIALGHAGAILSAWVSKRAAPQPAPTPKKGR